MAGLSGSGQGKRPLVHGMRPAFFAACLAAALLSIAGNARSADTLPAAPAAASAAPRSTNDGRPTLWLLGEVHDNAAQHALRLEAFKAMLAGGARPALLMEQFDRARQADIDRSRAAMPRPDADTLIAAAGGAGQWNWAFYRPFIQLALKYDLPLLAANVSRQEARAVMALGLAATGFDAAVPADMAPGHARDIESSHCGQLDRAAAERMASAQIARDQFMARLVEANAARGVVLLAGNGHVRTDLGVPRWLSPAARKQSVAVGYLEQGDAPAAAFDRVVVTPRQPRQDPCADGLAPAARPTGVGRDQAAQVAGEPPSIQQ